MVFAEKRADFLGILRSLKILYYKSTHEGLTEALEERSDAVLSEAWIQVSKKILGQLKRLEGTKGKDRLELVRSLRFVLSVIHRSLLGWTQWVNNPDVMILFTQEELGEMTENLSKLTQSFVKYDLKATSIGVKKGLKTPKKVVKNKPEDRTEPFYV